MNIDNSVVNFLKSAWDIVSYPIFASIGGVIGYVVRNPDSIVFKRACLSGISSAFMGQLVLMICQAMKINAEWIGAIVGISGLIGANATISILEYKLYKTLGVRKRRHEDPL